MKKTLALLLMMSSMMAASLSASADEQTIWQCQKDGNPKAVEVVYTTESWRHSSNLILRINDQDIARALSVKNPYEGGAGDRSWRYWYDQVGTNPVHFYVSVKGKYEDGVAFFSEGPGMKLVGLYTGSQTSINWGANWYFDPGYCVKLK